MKKWNIKHELRIKNQELTKEKLIDLLLENRGITSIKERDEFLHPKLEEVTPENVGIDGTQLKKTLQRLQKAFDQKEQIVIFGDYDVDGITASAILWETLYSLGFTVLPYIPHRVDEGYGLSIRGIENLKSQTPSIKLIITVDNGIVAHEAVDYANSLGIDVIITDHHMPEKEDLPDAYAIVHTTKLCGAGIAWLVSREIANSKFGIGNSEKNNAKGQELTANDSHLELAALGTIADLVALTGANRTIVFYGLEKLRQTNRPGLRALFQEAAISSANIGTYEVGFMIAPRLNAAGRIESAMDSLRLLCTKSKEKAYELAMKLGHTNRERQDLMKRTIEHAIGNMQIAIEMNKNKKKIIFIGDKTYNPGVIGLVAGKLVEEFYLPAIVLSIGEEHAKASVRSISGVNIIEFLRTFPDMYVNLGGHPMAAGFTVTVENMLTLQEKLEQHADKIITDDLLQRSLTIDTELPLSMVTLDLYEAMQNLAPFGMGNPEPVFASRNVEVVDMNFMGRERKHVKLKIAEGNSGVLVDAVGFNMADQMENLQLGDHIDIAYTVDQNIWNGNVSLQLKLKDIVTI